jgi:hypothetical protein
MLDALKIKLFSRIFDYNLSIIRACFKMVTNTKQEQSIREVIDRFETMLSGFMATLKERRSGVDLTYIHQAISKAIRRYIKHYVESYTSVQLIGIHDSVALAPIYISQKFQSYNSIRDFESVSDLEEAFTRDLQRSASCKGNNLLGINIANEEEYLMILGLPAAGKTTYLKYIGSEALRYPKSRYKHDLMPIFLQMRNFYCNTDTLLQAIAEELEKSGFPSPQDLAIWMLEQGKLLILFDGLNESVISHNHLSHLIKEFVNNYPQNRYIASSRLDAYKNTVGQFLEVELHAWGDLHIQEYIHKWYAIAQNFKDNHSPDIASESAQSCWKILQANPIARGLAKSPLNLSMLCLLRDRGYSLPSNVSRLYQKGIQVILEESILSQQLGNVEAGNSLSTEILELILTKLATRSFEIRQLAMPLDVVTSHIEDILNNYLLGFEELSTDFILKLLKNLGICKIIDMGGGTSFAFSHISFQEYFVALYIHERHKTKDLVANHLGDRHWQNVFLLLAGMMSGNVEELLIDIEVQSAKYINESQLRNVLIWLEKVASNATGDFKNVSKRIAALFLARPRFLLELAPALSLTRMLSLAKKLLEMFDLSFNLDKVFEAELSLSLAHALDFDSATELSLATQLCISLEEALLKVEFDPSQIKFKDLKMRLDSLHTQAPSYDQPFDVQLQFRNQLSNTWMETLYLPLDSGQLSLQEISNLENYLYANLLILKCKNAAIAIPKKTWQDIESRMLRISP